MVEPSRQLKRREEILAAAEEVFDAHGYTGTTVDAVAEAAGIAKGSVYNYFRNKRELFYEVFAHVVGGAEADISPTLKDLKLPAAEKLAGLLDYWGQRLGYFKRFGRLVLEFWTTAAREEQEVKLAGTFRQMYAHWRGQIASILKEGVASGEFNPDLDTKVAAALVMAMLDGIEIQSILDTGIKMDGGFLAAMKRSVLTSMSAGGQPGGEGSPRGETDE